MTCITVALEESFRHRLDAFPWVNWSEVGREEVLKRDIFDRYVKTRTLSKEDEAFCEEIDWHPVDELPLKREFVEELKKARNEPSCKPVTVKEFDKQCDES